MLTANRRFRSVLPSALRERHSVQLPDAIMQRFAKGIAWDGVVLVYAYPPRVTALPTRDLTGYECDRNDTSLHDFTAAAELSDSAYLARGLVLADLLRRAIPPEVAPRVRVILSVNGLHSTFRWHIDRPGEGWIDLADLEGFAEEAVGTWLLDGTADLEASAPA